jgi:hypothetical protein
METNYIWVVIAACATALGAITATISMIISNSRRGGKDSQQLKHVENILTNLPCKENTKQVIENSQQLKYHEYRLDNLPCKEHAEKIDKINIDVSTLDTSVNFILQSFGMNNKQSPFKLTELGLKVYKDMGGEQFLNQYGDMLIEKIEKINPKTAYDLENVALTVLHSLKDDDIFIPIKDILYEYPEVETEIQGMKKALSIFDVCYVFRIPLRDRYLKLHPEILPKKYQLSQKEE